MKERLPASLRSTAIGAGMAVCLATLSGCGGSSDDPTPAAPQASAQDRCSALVGQTIEGAVVTRARLIPPAADVPERCSVLGEMPQDLRFEVNLPSNWNSRTVFLGGGGFDGSYYDPTKPNGSNSPKIIERGYTTIATNHGHTGGGASFALDAQMLNEYGYLAVPRVYPAARKIVALYFGNQKTAGTKIIYEGCSGGGRQALIEAQRYPDLFDGIISRAPANSFTGEFTWYLNTTQQVAKPGAAVSAAKLTTIANAVYEKCDALDGLKDRIVSRPDLCTFDPAELKCTGAETDACLTDPQIESVRSFYAPTTGRYPWAPMPFGGEDQQGTPFYAFGGPVHMALADGYWRYFVTQNATVDLLTVNPAQFTSRLDQLQGIIDATNPDLSRFRAHGGKLVLWHGLTDTLITANNTTEYYGKVVAQAGGQADADQFVEYFTAPGVNHCFGGTGADQVDLIAPIFDWIEKGTRPSSIGLVATQTTPLAGETPVQRPLCKYPQFPKYNGAGDPKLSTSFTCTSP
jgi:pimeloyl-ACP methyl ester carboxylesterase